MEEQIKISVFASAVRPKLWTSYLESLKSTSVSYEVIFSGFNTPEEVSPFLEKYPEFKYIHTKSIKPCQNYAISQRACIGEVSSWSCDDASYDGDVLGKAYRYWKEKNNEKLILSIQTKESGYGNPQGSLFDMNLHRFFGGDPNSPIMAPMCIISTKFLNELGGYDRRFVCGQGENSIVMLAYQQGATVEIFGGPDCYIDIDHLGKSIAIGESKDEKDFLNRPFAKGYQTDRQILEKSWTTFHPEKLISILNSGRNQVFPSEIKIISKVQLDKFQRYEDEDILTKSQSNKGHWQ